MMPRYARAANGKTPPLHSGGNNRQTTLPRHPPPGPPPPLPPPPPPPPPPHPTHTLHPPTSSLKTMHSGLAPASTDEGWMVTACPVAITL